MSEKIKLSLFHSCVTNPNSREGDITPSTTGSEYTMTYKAIIDKDGKHQVIEDTKVNSYEKIQSHQASTDLHYLLQRYRQGDVEALNKCEGIYGDFSNAPRTLADYFEMQSEAQNTFLKLPTELREEFNNNPLEFLNLYGTVEFSKRVSNYNAKVTKPEDKAPLPPIVDKVLEKGDVVNE